MNRFPKIVSPLPVICVGNFTAGGTGKTPASIFLARQLLTLGYKPIFLSRGYGSSYSREARLVDKKNHTAQDVGDEPLLLADVAPVIVSVDRQKGINAILQLKKEYDIVIMDDGLQNSSVLKNCSIALIDGQRGLGNEMVIPSGPLRAPLEEQLKHADLIIINGGSEKRIAGNLIEKLKSKFNRKIFYAYTESTTNTSWLKGEKIIAYSGIANPDRFYKLLREHGAQLLDHKIFPDHHIFSAQQAHYLIETAKEKNCMLVTTEKDWVRLPSSGGALQYLKTETKYLPIELNMRKEEKEKFLDEVVSLIMKKKIPKAVVN